MASILDIEIKINENLAEGLRAALEVIEQYQLDVRNAKETIGVDLVKAGFCQGDYYKDAPNRILRKLKSKA